LPAATTEAASGGWSIAQPPFTTFHEEIVKAAEKAIDRQLAIPPFAVSPDSLRAKILKSLKPDLGCGYGM
jgi:hypothetical protein